MTTLVPAGVSPTGERVVREIPNIGTLVFENYGPGEWMTKKGEPAKISRRRYLLEPDLDLDSVSSITDTIRKEGLERWKEDMGARGAAEAYRLGELVDVPEEEIIKRVRLLKLGADARSGEGQERGTAIHAAFHTLATEGKPPNPADFPGFARPWVQGAMRAWLAMDPRMIASEEIVCCVEHGYAGRPDLVAMVDGKVTLIDYKTGKGRIYDTAHYQTRLYEIALRALGVDVERIVIVGIDDAGDFQLVECEASEADAVALIHTFRSRKRINAGMASQRAMAKAAAAA